MIFVCTIAAEAIQTQQADMAPLAHPHYLRPPPYLLIKLPLHCLHWCWLWLCIQRKLFISIQKDSKLWDSANLGHKLQVRCCSLTKVLFSLISAFKSVISNLDSPLSWRTLLKGTSKKKKKNIQHSLMFYIVSELPRAIQLWACGFSPRSSKWQQLNTFNLLNKLVTNFPT